MEIKEKEKQGDWKGKERKIKEKDGEGRSRIMERGGKEE